MNAQAKKLKDLQASSVSFRFGDSEALCNELLVLVRTGKKTATCEALSVFGPGGEDMPVVGRRDIALNWDGSPSLLLETTEVTQQRFCDVDAIFDADRAMNGTAIAQRLAIRREIAAPLVTDLEQWLRSQRAALARHNPVAGAIDYMLKDWAAFARFLDDGRICLTNNAAERALRGVALGRKAWLFAGSDRGGEPRWRLPPFKRKQLLLAPQTTAVPA